MRLFQKTHDRQDFWTGPLVILAATFICCFLWGSAFPCIKIGYRLFSIAPDDTFSQILFAGIRFFIAGILVMLFESISGKRMVLPQAKSLRMILMLALTQTVGQYFFFYVGLAHASGVKSSIISATNNFFAILTAIFIFHTEKMTRYKLLGCLIGFSGILLVELNGSALDLGFRFNGEGFIILSTMLYAISGSLIKEYAKKESAVILSGCQFMLGGLVLIIAGAAGGGHLNKFSAGGLLLLLYMGFISAAAYTLWGLLLAHNPVSKIAINGFMSPVLGALLSALLLNEKEQAFNLRTLLSIILVSAGIIVLNLSEKNSPATSHGRNCPE